MIVLLIKIFLKLFPYNTKNPTPQKNQNPKTAKNLHKNTETHFLFFLLEGCEFFLHIAIHIKVDDLLLVMRRKGLIGKETRDSGRVFYTALSNSLLQGDNLMTKHNQLKNDVAQVEASLKSFKEVRRGDN